MLVAGVDPTALALGSRGGSDVPIDSWTTSFSNPRSWRYGSRSIPCDCTMACLPIGDIGWRAGFLVARHDLASRARCEVDERIGTDLCDSGPFPNPLRPPVETTHDTAISPTESSGGRPRQRAVDLVGAATYRLQYKTAVKCRHPPIVIKKRGPEKSEKKLENPRRFWNNGGSNISSLLQTTEVFE